MDQRLADFVAIDLELGYRFALVAFDEQKIARRDVPDLVFELGLRRAEDTPPLVKPWFDRGCRQVEVFNGLTRDLLVAAAVAPGSAPSRLGSWIGPAGLASEATLRPSRRSLWMMSSP